MAFLGNLLWALLGGGLILSLEYLIGGIVLCITVIGIPFGIQKLRLGGLALAPFGREVYRGSTTAGCLSTLMNALWVLCGGIWIAATHMVLAILCFITIIGIPFARQHMKLASLAFAPFGTIVKQKTT